MSTLSDTVASLRELAESSSAWPFEEAKKILARLRQAPKDVVIFENLANLDKLMGKEFFFVGTPIALAGGTAGITRPVALLM